MDAPSEHNDDTTEQNRSEDATHRCAFPHLLQHVFVVDDFSEGEGGAKESRLEAMCSLLRKECLASLFPIVGLDMEWRTTFINAPESDQGESKEAEGVSGGETGTGGGAVVADGVKDGRGEEPIPAELIRRMNKENKKGVKKKAISVATKVALLQICGPTTCVLFRLCCCPAIWDSPLPAPNTKQGKTQTSSPTNTEGQPATDLPTATTASPSSVDSTTPPTTPANESPLSAAPAAAAASSFPAPLRRLLEDPALIKVGIGILGDQSKFYKDYGVSIYPVLDAPVLGYAYTGPDFLPKGCLSLKALGQQLCNIQLTKVLRITLSDWSDSSKPLSPEQVEYASDDARCSYAITEAMLKEALQRNPDLMTSSAKSEDQPTTAAPDAAAGGSPPSLLLQNLLPLCGRSTGRPESWNPYDSQHYHHSHSHGVTKKTRRADCAKLGLAGEKPKKEKCNTPNEKPKPGKPTREERKGAHELPARAKRYYDNIRIFDPSGALLCTADCKKADWYVNKKQLAIVTKVKEGCPPPHLPSAEEIKAIVERHNQDEALGRDSEMDPIPPTDPRWTDPESIAEIQLLFQPSAIQKVNMDYYTAEKKNECVICGAVNSLVRHFLVPVAYRKHLPLDRVYHNSYDIMLVCTKCFPRVTKMVDGQREHLAGLYHFPLTIAEQIGAGKPSCVHPITGELYDEATKPDAPAAGQKAQHPVENPYPPLSLVAYHRNIIQKVIRFAGVLHDLHLFQTGAWNEGDEKSGKEDKEDDGADGGDPAADQTPGSDGKPAADGEDASKKGKGKKKSNPGPRKRHSAPRGAFRHRPKTMPSDRLEEMWTFLEQHANHYLYGFDADEIDDAVEMTSPGATTEDQNQNGSTPLAETKAGAPPSYNNAMEWLKAAASVVPVHPLSGGLATATEPSQAATTAPAAATAISTSSAIQRVIAELGVPSAGTPTSPGTFLPVEYSGEETSDDNQQQQQQSGSDGAASPCTPPTGNSSSSKPALTALAPMAPNTGLTQAVSFSRVDPLPFISTVCLAKAQRCFLRPNVPLSVSTPDAWVDTPTPSTSAVVASSAGTATAPVEQTTAPAAALAASTTAEGKPPKKLYSAAVINSLITESHYGFVIRTLVDKGIVKGKRAFLAAAAELGKERRKTTTTTKGAPAVEGEVERAGETSKSEHDWIKEAIISEVTKFVIEWRTLFVRVMKPKHLPTAWDPYDGHTLTNFMSTVGSGPLFPSSTPESAKWVIPTNVTPTEKA